MLLFCRVRRNLVQENCKPIRQLYTWDEPSISFWVLSDLDNHTFSVCSTPLLWGSSTSSHLNLAPSLVLVVECYMWGLNVGHRHGQAEHRMTCILSPRFCGPSLPRDMADVENVLGNSWYPICLPLIPAISSCLLNGPR